MIRMVEAATHAGYPLDAAAVLLIEVEGLTEAVEEQAEAIAEVCQESGRAHRSDCAVCRRARSALERPKERLRSDRAREPDVLRTGRCRSADENCRNAAGHWRYRPQVQHSDQQRFPCRRRQHASDSARSTRAKKATWSGRRLQAKKSCGFASRSAAPSRASTASERRKRN